MTTWLYLYHRRTDGQTAFTLEDDFGSVQGSYCRFGKSASQGPGQEGAEHLPVITLQETQAHTVCCERGRGGLLHQAGAERLALLAPPPPPTLVQG